MKNEPSQPSAEPVKWNAWRLKQDSQERIGKPKVFTSRSFMLAREQAMMHFECGPQQLHVELKPARKKPMKPKVEELYVDPEKGDDKTGNGSYAKPYKTFKRMNEHITKAPGSFNVSVIVDTKKLPPKMLEKLGKQR